MNPLQYVRIHEVESTETMWSRWLAMVDGMVGPGAPGWEDQSPEVCRWAS
jgi:hypothetical protein